MASISASMRVAALPVSRVQARRPALRVAPAQVGPDWSREYFTGARSWAPATEREACAPPRPGWIRYEDPAPLQFDFQFFRGNLLPMTSYYEITLSGPRVVPKIAGWAVPDPTISKLCLNTYERSVLRPAGSDGEIEWHGG